MALYIDKTAVVAEIESKIKKYAKRGEESNAKCDGYGMYWEGVISCLIEIRALCGTLEVKEVDLQKEYDNKFFKDPVFCKLVNRNAGISIAKHFYEIGLNARKDMN